MRTRALFSIFGMLGVLLAQAPTFEAASVKVAVRSPETRLLAGMNGGPGTSDPQRVSYRRVTLQRLLMKAYGMQDYQIHGPDWLGIEVFDVIATLPPDTSDSQFSLMLQNLLAERFKLVVHREEKEMTVFDLEVAKGGAKLTRSAAAQPNPDGATSPAAAASPLRLQVGNMMVTQIGESVHLMGRGVSVATLVEYLSKLTARPVFDDTHLVDKFDIDLSFAPVDASAPGGDTIPGALQRQLGLELRSRKGSIGMLVIDQANKTPTEN